MQLGDTVKVAKTEKMYYVVDESKLSSEAGYAVYTAGTATSVPWSGVTGKPSSYPPASHNHDERYYTETEMNSKLAEKAAKVHTHVKSEVGLGNVDNTADANKSVKYATSAGSSTTSGAISSSGTLDTVAKLDAFIEGGKVKYATVSALDGLNGMIKNDGICISTPWSSTGYGHQFYINDNGYEVYHRFRNTTKVNNVDTTTWSSWKQILDSSNYNTYAPTKTGSGASGTWGINISGKSASTNAINWVAGNEIRFTKPSYTSPQALHFGWAWADNSKAKLISEYRFDGGDGNLTQVTASQFNGPLNGNANTATALTSSAGSATQPVYFSGGKPVACSYTLGKSVPADAKFTDTNTWRGVQNNLTSTATDQSLSAAQGKVLNEKKMGAVSANGYYGMAKPDGSASDWIRTTSSGIIPYQTGSRGSGHSALGTSTWYFGVSYIDSMYCNKTIVADKVRMEFDTTSNCLNFVFL